MMTELLLEKFTAVSCIGHGVSATLDALRNQRGGLAPCAFETAQIDTWIGEVSGIDEVEIPRELGKFNCRNNRLALMGLRQDDFEEAVARSAGRWGQRRIG